MQKSKILVLLLPCLSYAMEMEQPAIQKSNEEIWKALKQRVALMRELKAKFKQPEEKKEIPKDFIPQSLAHLKVIFGENKSEDELIKEAVNTFKTTAKLENKEAIQHVTTIINAEKQYAPFYVFYHGKKSVLSIINDLMQSVYGWFNIETPDQQTQFLRLFKSEIKEFDTVDAFLHSHPIKEYFQKSGFDWNPEVILNLLSTNVSLFGNTWKEKGGESTWHFYTESINVNPPQIDEQLTIFFNDFGFDSRFISEILKVHKEYMNKLQWEALAPWAEKNPGILLQIFVDPSIVDMISYLADAGGVYYELPALNKQSLEQYIMKAGNYYDPDFEDKKLYEDPDWLAEKRQILRKQVKDLEEEIFDDRLIRFLVSKYLDILRTKPKEIPLMMLNTAQARLYLKYSFFADPEKIKIKQYIWHPDQEMVKQAEKEYKQKLAVIVEQMMKDWLFKNKAKSQTRIERLFGYIQKELGTKE